MILSSVYDVKNSKLKIDGEEALYNSPWNIARSFDVPMEYSNEHDLVFDTASMAILIQKYTGGYPFLVCRICQIIDEEGLSWKGSYS